MNCEDSRIYLPAYLDDELDVAESLQVQEHLAHCADCRQEEEEHLELRSVLRNASLYASPSPEFARRIHAVIRRAAKQDARSRGAFWSASFRWATAAALAAVAAIGGMLAFVTLRPSHHELVADAVLSGHIRSLQANHLVDVLSSDQHTVKPWFHGKLDFAPPVPDLSKQGWALLGGRLDYVDGRPVAALVYQRRMHHINVFLWPGSGAAGSAVQQERAQGYQILHWNDNELAYWVVSDLNRPELQEFARALRGH